MLQKNGSRNRPPIQEEADDPFVRDIPPEVMQQMIRELPTGYRMVFNLYVFENKSHQEIADMLLFLWVKC